MTIEEKISKEVIKAMKSKDSPRVNALKYIKSLLQTNATIAKPLPELDVVMLHHKKMTKMIDVYQNQLLEDLKQEINIIEEFIPKAMSLSEISSLIDKHLELKNMGAIMKAVKAEIVGPFDGKTVSRLVKSKLS